MKIKKGNVQIEKKAIEIANNRIKKGYANPSMAIAILKMSGMGPLKLKEKIG